MNVLIVITRGDIGGAQMSVYHLAKGLAARGVSVTVGFGTDSFLGEKLRATNIPFVTFRHLCRSFNPLTNLLFVLEMRRFLSAHRMDIVHFNSSNALLGAVGAKLSSAKPKTVFTFRGLSLLDSTYSRSLLWKTIGTFVFRILLLFVDTPIFVSQNNEIYARKTHLTSRGRVIYNGLAPDELHFFTRDESRTKLTRVLGASIEDHFVIGSIGRLAYQKNYEFLIHQWKAIQQHIPNALGIIIGDGPKRKMYEHMIQDQGIRTSFFLAGAVPDGYRYLTAFDLFVLPSRYEGLSITLLETLFAGLPVVASDVGGNAEVLVPDAGVLYPLDNSNAFIQAITRLYQHPHLRQQLADHARARVERFSVGHTVEGYLSLYQEIKG